MEDLKVRDIISEENLATSPVTGVGMDEPAEAGRCSCVSRPNARTWQVVRGNVRLCIHCGAELEERR